MWFTGRRVWSLSEMWLRGSLGRLRCARVSPLHPYLWVNPLPCRHEDLSFHLQIHVRGQARTSMSITLTLGRQRQVEPHRDRKTEGPLVSQAS